MIPWFTPTFAAEPDWPAITKDYPGWPRAVESKAPPEVLTRCRMAFTDAETGPHGDHVVVHVNEVARAAFATPGARTFPVGSVLVKVKLGVDPATPLGLGLMVKREEGYAKDRGDWQYATVEAGKTHNDQAALGHCAACHSSGTAPDLQLDGATLGKPRDAVFLTAAPVNGPSAR